MNHVLLSGVRVNGALNTGAASIVIARAEKVRIEQTAFGWAQQERAGIRLVDAGDVELDGVHCLEGHNRIEADRATRSLVVRNCIYGTLSSAARITRIARDGLEGPPVVTTSQRNALGQPPPAQSCSTATADLTPAESVALWADLMNTCEEFILAGLRREIGPEGDLKAAYRAWYAGQMEEHDRTIRHMLEELFRRSAGYDG